jgi:formylglycine-generating enzyme required for sulfatase activity/CheY-like chemotaxis protein
MSQTVLIVHPDPAVAERLGQLILEGTPDASVSFVQRAQDGIDALAGYEDLDLCLCEAYFEDGDGLAFLSTIRTRFRRARVMIVTSYDLQNFSNYLQGLTLFPLPLDEPLFAVTCQDALATLEGHEFPPFRLGKKQPPDRWGDCYAAYDTGVKRDVFMSVLRAGASAEEARWFRESAIAMARAGHPNVQAVYQGGQYHGRDFFSREKWDVPNLVEMATAGQRIEPRLAAQIVHIVGSLVIFWDANSFPHTTVGATDVTVSSQGVIKVANCVDPALVATPPGISDLTTLAHAVYGLLPPLEEVPERLQTLLARISQGPVPLAEVVGEAQAIDIELAPEREIAVTAERQVARVAIRVERRKQQRNFYFMVAASVLLILGVGYVIYSRFFAPPASRAFNQMAYIPAGSYTYQDDPATMDHPYYIDKYEVTLGQYLKFLKAVKAAGTDAAWRHPLQKQEKDHQPTDWVDHVGDDGVTVAGIFSAIKNHQAYHKEFITLDYPVFNIDWFDAQAYAKWAGKRLPNEHEWEKAARGAQGFLFPWGNTFESNANTWVMPPGTSMDNEPPPPTQMVVDESPRDKSPYGVFNMAGNVSEWTDDLVPSTRISSIKVAVIRGANFTTKLIDHENLTNRVTVFVPDSRFVWLGFRCASDTLPPAQQ